MMGACGREKPLTSWPEKKERKEEGLECQVSSNDMLPMTFH
jgi:hypothetical protein